MKVKLVAIDLDDTLLNPGLEISPGCAAAIRAVREKGILVTLATGRMYRSALPYALQLGVDIPLITYQGALVQSSLSEDILYYKPVPRQAAREVMSIFKDMGVHYHTYFQDDLYMDTLTPEGMSYLELAGVRPVIVNDLIETLQYEESIKIMAIIKNETQVERTEQILKNIYGTSLNITRSKPHFLEIMNCKANKAIALQVIARHYNIDRSEVLAVGDSYNDLEMIQWAGIGVAMGNARKRVKEVADFVTLTNEEEGVAEALYKYVL
ncbi:MAG: HAD family phosphatase [Syntrophomonadaceae bacterium]|nr:HAD family phosphatase [Syntrophomonadaceae bacterium]